MTQASPERSPEPNLAIRVSGLSEGLFDLVHFRGREALSTTPTFELELTTTSLDVPAASLLNVPAVVEVRMLRWSRQFRGILSSFEYIATNPHTTTYRTILTPRLSWLAAVRQSRVFLDKTVPEIVGEVLAEYGLERGEDYQLRLRAEYLLQEYIVQYQETDLAFVSRLLEHHGIYYYFEPDLDRDFVVFADHVEAHTPVNSGGELNFRAGRPTSPAGPAVSELSVRQVSPPRELLLKDYNYRKPAVDQRGLATQPDSPIPALGRIVEYGDHFKTPEEGDRLAAIRLEERSCTGCLFRGVSGYPTLAPGLYFTLADHFKTECNGEFLLIEVEHDIRQPGAPSAASALVEEESYKNSFRAIPRKTQFRPARVTQQPKILGTLHATIDAAGTGEYAEIDEQGRYKVRLPFDLAGREAGKASRFIRMAQPYAGPEYGSHFPLHKGTEVLLTHIDGDPDRPIIAAAIPNPATASPVRSGNHTQSVIRTAANNHMVMEDAGGAQRILISTPTASTSLNLGAPNGGVSGVTLSTADHELRTIGQNSSTTIGINEESRIGSNRITQVGADDALSVGGNRNEQVGGTVTVKAGANVIIEAGTAITLQCGASSLHMNQAGFITLSGVVINIAAAINANMAAPITNVVGAVMSTNTGAVNVVTGGVVARVMGAQVEAIASGDNVVRGGTVKINT